MKKIIRTLEKGIQDKLNELINIDEEAEAM